MRKINRIIIHCTATPEGRAVPVSEIKGWHLQNGWSDIGYHYIIGLDGKVEAGRNIEVAGAHTQGYNSNSVGVCYVGGVDKSNKAKDTRTIAQKDSLAKLIKELKSKYPQATIHGHCEFANKACPSFDVSKWLKEIGM